MALEGLVCDESVANPCNPTVLPDWMDYNDHFNVAYYARAFDLATAEFFADAFDTNELLLMPSKAKIDYLQEVPGGHGLRFTTQILASEPSDLHLLQAMYDAETNGLVAIQERRDRFWSRNDNSPVNLAGGDLDRLTSLVARHASYEVPDGWGSL